MEWHEYIEALLDRRCAFDNITLSLNNEEETVIPPIIKTSILMLDQMISAQEKYNIFVFPEKSQTLFIFLLLKLLHNITEGKIEKIYNPESFNKGEKLKFRNCVVAFNRIDMSKEEPYLWVDTADCAVGAPIEYAPLFQRTTTNRRLSKDFEFSKAKQEARGQLKNLSQAGRYLALLSDYKTHLDSSIYYMAPVNNTKEQLAKCSFSGKDLMDILLIGQADYSGEIRNIGAGQMAGTPAIVLASDLYAICSAVEKNAPIQSLIIDVSNHNICNAQLDALDEIMRIGIPILCITDIANSFELQNLTDRGFNIWRWDEESITENLYNNDSSFSLERKIRNCAKRKIDYIIVDENKISDSIKKLFSYKMDVQEQSSQMISLFDRLFSSAFNALRSIAPISSTDSEHMQLVLSECSNTLEREKRHISDISYQDYKTVISDLEEVFASSYIFPKIIALQHHLITNNYSTVYLVVPDRVEKNKLKGYWQDWCAENGLNTMITIFHPAEYYSQNTPDDSATIIAGWLNNLIMRKILYGFNTNKFVILMYDCERRWKNSHVTRWSRILNNSNNKKLVKQYFNSDSLDISVAHFHSEQITDVNIEPDELDELELVLRENKYRQYVVEGGRHSVDETVEAIPVNFAGGYFALFRDKHKVITVTDIIVKDGEKAEMKDPAHLEIGDFVVVRETGRDLIRELADTILVNSGKPGLRDTATKWKESLIIEAQLFSTYREIYEKLKAAGCSVTYQTVRSWIVDEEKISPDSKEDLEYIAKVTEDAVLLEMIDKVYDAGREVNSAHIQAGKYLSGQLKKTIASAIHKYGNIDPFNIWDPITLTLDNIGIVKILKVIDIGSIIVVDAANINRLIEEK